MEQSVNGLFDFPKKKNMIRHFYCYNYNKSIM